MRTMEMHGVTNRGKYRFAEPPRPDMWLYRFNKIDPMLKSNRYGWLSTRTCKSHREFNGGTRHRARLTGEKLKRVDAVGGRLAYPDGRWRGVARTTPNDMPCTDADYSCCEHWKEMSGRSLSVAERLAHAASALAGENASNAEIINILPAAETARIGTIGGWPGPTRISPPKTTRSRPNPTKAGCVRAGWANHPARYTQSPQDSNT